MRESRKAPMIGVSALASVAVAAGLSFGSGAASAESAATNNPADAVLYSQNDHHAGARLVSERSTATPEYSAAGADDFTVPSGTTWTLSQVDVTGNYDERQAPATTVRVTIYTDTDMRPGPPVASYVRRMHFKSASFQLPTHGQVPPLTAGTYWLSVQVDGHQAPQYQFWAWSLTSVRHGATAVWENPLGGWTHQRKCLTWTPVKQCQGGGPDFMFDLKGKRS